MPPGQQCLWPWAHGGVIYQWPWAHGDWTPLLIKTVELSFGRNRCPLGHSAYGHGPMGVTYLWPWPHGGHLSMAMAPWGSPTYGHGPMGGPPVYGHGPMGVTYLWPWAHGYWTHC